jgi:hypothetical protein
MLSARTLESATVADDHTETLDRSCARTMAQLPSNPTAQTPADQDAAVLAAPPSSDLPAGLDASVDAMLREAEAALAAEEGGPTDKAGEEDGIAPSLTRPGVEVRELDEGAAEAEPVVASAAGVVAPGTSPSRTEHSDQIVPEAAETAAEGAPPPAQVSEAGGVAAVVADDRLDAAVAAAVADAETAAEAEQTPEAMASALSKTLHPSTIQSLDAALAQNADDEFADPGTSTAPPAVSPPAPAAVPVPALAAATTAVAVTAAVQVAPASLKPPVLAMPREEEAAAPAKAVSKDTGETVIAPAAVEKGPSVLARLAAACGRVLGAVVGLLQRPFVPVAAKLAAVPRAAQQTAGWLAAVTAFNAMVVWVLVLFFAPGPAAEGADQHGSEAHTSEIAGGHGGTHAAPASAGHSAAAGHGDAHAKPAAKNADAHGKPAAKKPDAHAKKPEKKPEKKAEKKPAAKKTAAAGGHGGGH